MNSEIEKLIDLSLADGKVTEKERSVILRKASEIGEDLDEVEMVLEAKLHITQKNDTLSSPNPEMITKKSRKDGDLKKCPSCGSPTISFSTKCSDCGHEFRNTEVSLAKQKLHDDFNKIELEERNRELSFLDKLGGDQGVLMRINRRKASLISSFPLPNSKEDLLEFFSLSIAESNKKMSVVDDESLTKAWTTKSKELKSKIELDLKNDPHAMSLINEYNQNIKKFSISSKTKFIIGYSIGIIVLFVVIFYMISLENDDKNIEIQRIESVELKIEELVREKRYEEALIQVEKISWDVSPKSNKELVISTNEKKEGLKKTLQNLILIK